MSNKINFAKNIGLDILYKWPSVHEKKLDRFILVSYEHVSNSALSKLSCATTEFTAHGASKSPTLELV